MSFSTTPRYLITFPIDTALFDRQLGLPSLIKNTQLAQTQADLLSHEPIVIVDPSRKQKKWILTMIDQINGGILSMTQTPVRCHWDHHEFVGVCLGCPLSKINKEHLHTYQSQIFKRDVTTKVYDPLHTEVIGYYTEGIFCSFECALAYAESKKKEVLYRDSSYLLQEIYLTLFGNGPVKPKPIAPAPPHTILKAYGGRIDIETFRTQKNVNYIPTKGVYFRMFPVGMVFEQNLTL